MSNDQLDERRERECAALIANRLNLSIHQLDELEWSIDENTGNDGTVYGYIVTFENSDDTHVQEMINRITDGQGWVQISADL